MPDDPRVQKLLEEMLESHATPEEVCASCIELLPVVRERWRQFCLARAELEAMFPPEADASHPTPLETSLPVIAGYEVEAVLGLGGMGVVFRARHLRLNRVVAVKMALAGAYAGPHERERFQREAEAVASLRHANVIQIYEVGDSGGRSYFAMEYVEGGNLAQKLAGTPLPARDAAALLGILAGAVHSAHSSGVVHRDLKPANVLLTLDGTPKISDFGLARRLGGEAGLTRTGAAVGTPSYMAPEQAKGAADAAGPPADIYALGAILYELLTGRPPFRAETGAETIQQVISQDPVPPSRLNGKVPRDLETICLKCLHKDPRSRYSTAAAVAADVHCFIRGETIAARPEGGMRRLARKVRRRPALSAAIAMSTLLTLALIGGGLWFFSDRQSQAAATKAKVAAVEHAADEDLNEMEESLRKSLWTKAKDAWARANTRLDGRGSPDLRRRLDQGARDRELADRLNSIQRDTANTTAGRVDIEQIKHDYESVFRERFGSFQDDPTLVAERIAASNICNALVAALDNWAAYSPVWLTLTDQTDAALRREKVPEAVILKLNFMKGKAYERSYLVEKLGRVLNKDEASQFQAVVLNHAHKTDHLSWILAVAREAVKQRAENHPAERDPTGWTYRARDPDVWKNEAEFTRLLETAPVTEQSAPLLVMLAQRYRDLGKNPIPFLLRIQQAHPEDFTVNTSLGFLMSHTQDPRGALRYYQAALAVRPWTALAHDNLGMALAANAQFESAIEQHRIALQIDPAARSARFNLAIALAAHGPFDEGIKECNLALRYYPDNIVLLGCLAKCLEASGRDAEAVAAYRKTVRLQPLMTPFQTKLRALLIRLGRLDEARQAWQSALESTPSEHDAWYGYAEFCLFLGNEDEYRVARRTLLNKFGKEAHPQIAERISRACLLYPISGDELHLAVSLAERAVAVDRSKYGGTYPYFLFAKGLAEYRQGRFDRSISIMNEVAPGVSGPSPRLVLAMAYQKCGREAEARKALAAAIPSHDWRATQVKDQDGWIYHSLRREAERLILPNLPAFLEGKHLPADNEERLALLGVCQFTNRSLALANLYSDAFAAAPGLAEEYRIGHRFNAACAAARASNGIGADVAGLSMLDRAKWRTQAREWIRADLASCKMLLDRDLVSARDVVRDKLTRLRDNPDLAGLGDPAQLEHVSADDRKQFLALWNEIGIAIKRTEKNGR